MIKDDEFISRVKSIITDERYLQLKKYIAHSDFTVYDHSLHVAEESYLYVKRHQIKCDIQSLVIGALLHDYYLYDWHDKKVRPKMHGFKHSRIAMENAIKDFHINKKEQSIILTHMYPVNFFLFPKSKEARIVSLMDKKCALYESYSTKKVENVRLAKILLKASY